MALDRLGELRLFVAILDAGSLAGAARRLGRSPPAVSRVLAELEARLGVTLLERTSRRCLPTDAGRRLADQARHLLSSYEEAVADAAGEATQPKGALRVTAPLVFGRVHVAPSASDFLDRHPAITLELQLLDRVVDLHEENFDVGVRIGPVGDTSLIRRGVGQVRQVAVASPAYLTARGLPAVPEDLAKHEAIRQTGAGVAAPWVLQDRSGAPRAVRVEGRFAVNSADAALAAARAGRGIVRALSYQVDDDLREGRLVRVLEAFEPPPLPVALVWPDFRRHVRRVRLLVDFLAERLAGLPVLL